MKGFCAGRFPVSDPMITTRPQDLVAHEPGSYDDLTALATAEHAVGVYRSPSDYGFAARAAGFEFATVLESWPVQVGFAVAPGLILISPRGSDDVGDWIGNVLSIGRVGWRGVLPRGCRAGTGFVWQARRMSDELVRRVEEALATDPGAEIVLDGHSLGAPLAALFVALLHSRGVRSRVAYLHEPPRTGNRTLQAWYDETFTRGATPTYTVVNVLRDSQDLVTRLPFRRLGARHLGHRATHVEGVMLEGRAAWQAHRRLHPVGFWRGLRFVTRLRHSIRAHRGKVLLETLGARVEALG